MTRGRQRVLFALFFASGFCGLLYQVVWTRLAFAAFGVITPVLSVVISVFMLGLALGSWGAGKWTSTLARRSALPALGWYALAELCIGLSAFAVPWLLARGQRLLLVAGQTDSATFLAFSAAVLALAILPWCVCMGATFPLMMAHIRERNPDNSDSFSFLYLANVLGAMTGTVLTALALVEWLGFSGTLAVAAGINGAVAMVAVSLAAATRASQAHPEPRPVSPAARGAPAAVSTDASPSSPKFYQAVLFTTGFVSMALEVVWVRYFAPVLKTEVYSFALILATYLAATFAGSLFYRRDLRGPKLLPLALLLGLLSASAFLPALANDYRFVVARWWDPVAEPGSVLLLLGSIAPFCAVLGYLTPAVIDRCSSGAPRPAGTAYALNVLGCILGPLVASYLLLPFLSERYCLLLLALPLLALFAARFRALHAPQAIALSLSSSALFLVSLFVSRPLDEHLLASEPGAMLRRDHAASVLSIGTGMNKQLIVNGMGMTALTPITKFMTHLPLALNPSPPASALVICFGMGTSFRSALSWDIDATAVELVPSVKHAFAFYHTDAPKFLAHPKARIVVDDGRRFLQRSNRQYDAVIIDPPPPVQTAGSSLLYSEEFYDCLKQRLAPGGIVQAWIPESADVTPAAVRSLWNTFPHIRCFRSIEGQGLHLLASMQPIVVPPPDQLINRMSAAARADLLEWAPTPDLHAYWTDFLSRELPAADLLDPRPRLRITDDRPYNEYYLLRYFGLLR